MSRGSRGCGVRLHGVEGSLSSEPAQAELYSKLWSALLLFTHRRTTFQARGRI